MYARYNVFKYLLSLYLTKVYVCFLLPKLLWVFFRPFQRSSEKINVKRQKEFITILCEFYLQYICVL